MQKVEEEFNRRKLELEQQYDIENKLYESRHNFQGAPNYQTFHAEENSSTLMTPNPFKMSSYNQGSEDPHNSNSPAHNPMLDSPVSPANDSSQKKHPQVRNSKQPNDGKENTYNFSGFGKSIVSGFIPLQKTNPEIMNGKGSKNLENLKFVPQELAFKQKKPSEENEASILMDNYE